MAKRRLSMRKIKEVLRLKWAHKLSNRKIAKSCFISRSTVADYLLRAKLAGLSWPIAPELDDAAIDPAKWSLVEIAREISDGKLRLNIEGRGERVTNPLELTDSKTPYLETKVLVENGSHVSGNSGHVRLVARFYNDSRGPGSGKDYKGLKGDVWVTNRIILNEDGSLVAAAGAWRFDDPVDGNIGTSLFWEEFLTLIDFDIEYTLSMEFTGSEIIFKCNDETLTYQLDTPAYPPAENYRAIRSRMNSGGTGYIKAQIDDVYTIPSLRILAPNGGEVIPSGSVYTVRWAAPPEAETFKLKFSDDNGKTWDLLADGITGTSYDADVYTPTKNKKNSLIKIIAYDASGKKVGKDTSDDPFTVEVLTVTSPTEGDTLTSRDIHTITWTTNGTEKPVDKVKLKYTKNGGRTWKMIGTVPGGDPGEYSYGWEVPDVPQTKTKCMVKIVLKDANQNNLGKDVSDDYFTIQTYLGYTYDDFEGPSIDESKWDIRDTCGVFTQGGGSLNIDGPPFDCVAYIWPKTKFSGDFDFVADWQNWNYQGEVTFEGDLPLISMEVQGGEENFVDVTRSAHCVGDCPPGSQSYGGGGFVNGVWLHGLSISTYDTAGKFRITRSGSEATIYYLDNGWQELFRAPDFGLEDVSIQLHGSTGANTDAIFHAEFTQLEIVKGTAE